MVAAIFSKLEEQREEQRNDLRIELEEQRKDLRNQQEEQRNDLCTKLEEQRNDLRNQQEEQRNELRKQREEQREELRQIQQLQHEQKNQMDRLEEGISRKIEEQCQTLRTELREEFQTQHQELRKECLSQNTEFQRNLKSFVSQQAEELQNRMETQQGQILEESKSYTNQECDILKVTISTLAEEMKTTGNENQKSFEQVGERLTEHGKKIRILEEDIIENKRTYQPQVYVTCTGSTGNGADMTTPKFHGREHNPMEQLKKIQRYYERKRNHDNSGDETEKLFDILDNCFDSHAARWLTLVKQDIKTWDDFQESFERKYWNREVQRGIKQRLEIEKYRPQGKLTRSEYFTERVITLKTMQPPIPEDEIVTCLAEHFEDIIQDAKRVQNITTICEFESLLHREDIKDSHNKSRHIHRPTSPNHFPISRFTSNRRPEPSHHNNRPPQNYPNFRGYQQNFNYQSRPPPGSAPVGRASGGTYPTRNMNHHPAPRHQETNYPNKGNHYFRREDRQENRLYHEVKKPQTYPTTEQVKVCHTIAEKMRTPRRPEEAHTSNNSPSEN